MRSSTQGSSPSIQDKACTLCRLHAFPKTVCHPGSRDRSAEVLVITDIPSRSEDESGRAPQGRSMDFLLELMGKAGLKHGEFAFLPAVACRPQEGRAPTKTEIKACRHWLQRRIEVLNPKYVLLLGATALATALDLKGIKKLVNKPIEYEGRIYLPMMSPSIVLYDPAAYSRLEHSLNVFHNIIEFGGIPRERELNYVIVDRWSLVKEMLKDLKGTVSCDLETTGLYPWAQDAQVVSIGFGTATTQWILPGETSGVFRDDFLREAVELITNKLEDCLLVGHNFKFDSLWMRVRFGVEWYADFDTMLAHFLLDENDQHSLKYLAQKFLGAPDWDIDTNKKKEWSMKTAEYHAHDLFYTRRLRDVFKKKLELDPAINQVFKKVLMPCSRLFAEAEHRGVYINTTKMGEAETYLRSEVASAEEELKKIGPDTNWASPKQVAELLFDRLGIEVIETTPTGARSVSESVIKRIDHPVSKALLRHRAANKQLASFIEGWKPFLVKSRLHPSFKLHGTVTGRLSCEHPNLQQVPRDKRIRSLITAPPGWTLVEADLSQIELRIAAELANERNMLHAFSSGIDVHWLTAIREIARGGGLANEVNDTATAYLKSSASDYAKKHDLLSKKKITYGDSIQLLLEMGPDKATEIFSGWKEYRKKAKAVNFGYLYGMWWKKFKIYARDNYGVTVTDKQAQESREAFFTLYSDLDPWHKRQRNFVRENGFVRSLSGRKRRLPQAMSYENTPERKEAERQAINSPVQSFANEINLMAALQLAEEFPRSVMNLVGTVHDAVLLEVRDEWVERVTRRVLEVMSGPKLFKELDIELSVPVEAEASIGPWGSGVSLKEWLENQDG